jgi:hypothetical protein
MLVPDMPAAEHFAVLVRETAHEVPHRGDRRDAHGPRNRRRSLVAFVACSAIGFYTNTSSSDYIRLDAGDKATLAESLGFIQQPASLILQAIGLR